MEFSLLLPSLRSRHKARLRTVTHLCFRMWDENRLRWIHIVFTPLYMCLVNHVHLHQLIEERRVILIIRNQYIL